VTCSRPSNRDGALRRRLLAPPADCFGTEAVYARQAASRCPSAQGGHSLEIDRRKETGMQWPHGVLLSVRVAAIREGMRIMTGALGTALVLCNLGVFSAATHAQKAKVVREPRPIIRVPVVRTTPYLVPRYRYRPQDDSVDRYRPPVAPVIRYGNQEAYIPPWTWPEIYIPPWIGPRLY
jgi:hypothetical protein